MFFLTLVLTIFQTAQAQVAPRVENLAPLEVIGRRRPSPPRQISVGAGIGAEDRSEPANALGIPLRNMERLADISLDRRAEVFEFEPARTSYGLFTHQIFARGGRAQSVRARSSGRVSEGDLMLSFGGARDKSRLAYIDNNNTPSIVADDFESGVTRSREEFFAGARFDSGPWSVVAEADQAKRKVLAGKRDIGESKTLQMEGALSRSWEGYSAGGFIFSRSSRFQPQIATMRSSEQKGSRYGAYLASAPTILGSPSLEASLERLNRSGSDLFFRDYERRELELRWARGLPRELWLEGELSVKTAYVADSSGGSKRLYRPWEAGVYTSTPNRFLFGASGRTKRYARVPRPSEIFGDGAILLPNPDLPIEEGWRAEAGPWFKIPNLISFSIEGFAEEAKNAALPVAASALNARVIAVGGVWVRGVTARTRFEMGPWWAIGSEFTLQEALNASAVNWERGRPLPGRPRKYLRSSLDYSRKRVSASVSHSFRSGETLDTAGFRRLQPRHHIGFDIGYRANRWRLGGEVRNLFPRRGIELGFEGTAGANVLEPVLEQREFALVVELLW